MVAYAWATLVCGALLAGASLVWLLSLQRSRQPIMLILGMSAAAASAFGLSRVISSYGTAQATAVAALVAIGCFVGGYGIASSLLANMAREPHHLDLATPLEDSPRADTSVLIVACAEPQRYEPSAVAKELEHLEDAGLPTATIGITPFLYAAQKARYRAAGGESPSMLQVKSLVVRVENLLDRQRFGWVDLVTCRPKDRLDVATVKTAKRGFSRIIVGAVSVADSREIDVAKSAVDALRPEEHALSVTYAAPLWASDPIVEMLAERIWQAVGADPTTAGVALLMHGQPDAYEQSHATFDVQENAFCNRIRMLLLERGVPEASVRLCWMDWRLPDVTETVRHLAALGCTRIVVSPACFPFESISTLLDLPLQTRQARVDENVFVTVLAAWGDDPVVGEAIATSIRAAALELD